MIVHTSQRRSHIPVAVFISTVLLGLLLDQGTKLLALRDLTFDSFVPILGGLLHLTLVRNPGATLGTGSGKTMIISIVAILISIVIAIFALRTTSTAWACVMGITLSGSVGNIIDRVIYAQNFLDGEVVDFINYGPFVGNVADVLLGVAVAGIIVLTIMGVHTGIPRVDRMLFDSTDSTDSIDATDMTDSAESADDTEKIATDETTTDGETADDSSSHTLEDSHDTIDPTSPTDTNAGDRN